VEPLNLHEYEALAAARLERAPLDYYRGGAEDEGTLRANRAAFAQVALRPRVLVDVDRIDLSTSLLGTRVDFPVLVAPVAYQRLAHPDGEAATARAAAAAATLMVVSTLATTTLEDVAAAAPGAPRWFQLYIYRDRGVSTELVRRAEAAGYGALVLTVDTPRLGRREADMRNGFGLPPHLCLANFQSKAELAREPSRPPGESGIAHYAAQNLDGSLDWKAIAWLRSITRLPIILKGIVTGEDAALACQHGVDGIVVSNHGGRQLDGAVATLEALPEVVAAVEGRAEVYVDGGVRRGTDVLKALALGARAVLIGRPVLWGLAVGGEAGVRHVLRLLRDELDLAMALSGKASLADVDGALVRVRATRP
jgi:4-hydroxymandelate oxidase